MFVTENVAALFKKGTLKLVPTEDGYKREAEATLVIEPFTPRLARELGDDIADHLFLNDEIREELEAIDLRVTVGVQNVIVRRAHPRHRPEVRRRLHGQEHRPDREREDRNDRVRGHEQVG